jgi:hypothetical protein
MKCDAFLSTREAFRVMELFSYDSNFVTSVVDQGTPLILDILSAPSEQFVGYLNETGSFQQYICIIIFRIIANLHCFNPDVSPKDHEGKFVRTILHLCSTIFKLTESGEVIPQRVVCPARVMANLFYLFQWVTFRSSYTVQEHNFWQDFLAMLEQHLGIKYPTINVHSNTPSISSGSSGSARTFQMMDSDGMSETDILRGLSVSFGKVRDQEYLRSLIRTHGGQVLNYVSKSVTHVICSDDDESLIASQPKIASAATKQVPACSDRLIYDSVERGVLQHERIYLLSDHPYKRRV